MHTSLQMGYFILVRCLVTLAFRDHKSLTESCPVVLTHTVDIRLQDTFTCSSVSCCADTRAEALLSMLRTSSWANVTAYQTVLRNYPKHQGESLSRRAGGNEVRGGMLGFTWKGRIQRSSVLSTFAWEKRLMGWAMTARLTVDSPD